MVPYHHYIYANSVPLQIKSVLNTRINLSEYIKDANLERKRVGRPDNIVLIIGESHNKNHSSLYGYTKEPVILKRSVTVAARGTIGYCEIREGGYVPIIRLLAVTPNDIGGDVYLHQVFNRIKFKNDGSIQQQLTVPSIASIEIPYPDTSALKTFANITYPFIEKIKLNKIQIEELTKQRDKLLPLLMNGQVSVNSDLSVH